MGTSVCRTVYEIDFNKMSIEDLVKKIFEIDVNGVEIVEMSRI